MIRNEIMNQKQLRDYGFLMGGVVSILFGAIPWLLLKKPFAIWPWYVLGIFWSLSIIYPSGLRPIYQVWMRVGGILGKINSTLILTLCYFFLFVPVAVFFKIMKRDRLHRNFSLTRGDGEKSFRTRRELMRDTKQMEQPF